MLPTPEPRKPEANETRHCHADSSAIVARKEAQLKKKIGTPQQLNKLDKIELILGKREVNRLDLGVVPRPVLRCGIPLQKPAEDYLVHTSRDGNCELNVEASPRYGMPFGRDLITPLWLFSEAYAQKSRTVRFHSGRAMLRSMGLNEDGRTFKWVTGSIERNFGATWEFTIQQELMGRIRRERHYFRLVSSAVLWFTPNRNQLDFEGEGFQNAITLTEEAYALAQKRGYQARLEIETVAALSHSPGAMRLFMLLRDRCAQVPEHKSHGWIPLTGPAGLDIEMGAAKYTEQRKWRVKVKKWLEEIGRVWPECPTEIHEGKDGFYRLQIPRCLPAGRE